MTLMPLVSGLNSLIKAVNSSYKKYSELQDIKRESLVSFQKASSLLASDLRMYKVRIESILAPSQEEALSRFLSTNAGAEVFEVFVRTLSQARDCILNDFSPRNFVDAEVMLRGVRRGAAAVIFANSLSQSTNRIKAATAKLQETSVSIECAYKSFYALYLLHQMPPQNVSRYDSSRREPAELHALDNAVAEFNQHPFHLSTTHLNSTSIYKLN